MKLPIILSTLFSSFAMNPPSLCELVYTDATGSPYTDTSGHALARYCEWTGPDAAVLDSEVCCDIGDDGAACTLPDEQDRCPVGERYFCEYGEALPGGSVVCAQPFPSMCDAGLCVEAPSELPPTLAFTMACCAPGGVCQMVTIDDMYDCQGSFLVCDYGAQNTDGTVDCYDY